jgi:hypothetical protein
MMRDVAATRLSARFVLGFGTNPRRVVSLEEAMADGTSAAEPAANFTGLITLTARATAARGRCSAMRTKSCAKAPWQC